MFRNDFESVMHECLGKDHPCLNIVTGITNRTENNTRRFATAATTNMDSTYITKR